MAGNANRSRFTAAGYVQDEYASQESELYLERDRAGFARELIRDNSRVGYAAPALDDDGLPFDFFSEAARREEERARARQERIRVKRQEEEIEELTFGERVSAAMRREPHAVAICVMLVVLNLTLIAFWGRMMIQGVNVQSKIEMYENGAAAYQQEIDSAKMHIELARNGERIRNKAQNELGMMRGELVDSKTIYIQTSSLAYQSAPIASDKAQGETSVLDWLLSVADIFDFKS